MFPLSHSAQKCQGRLDDIALIFNATKDSREKEEEETMERACQVAEMPQGCDKYAFVIVVTKPAATLEESKEPRPAMIHEDEVFKLAKAESAHVIVATVNSGEFVLDENMANATIRACLCFSQLVRLCPLCRHSQRVVVSVSVSGSVCFCFPFCLCHLPHSLLQCAPTTSTS